MKEFPPFRLDTVNECLWRHRDGADDERIRLTPKAFAVLRYLVEHPGRLVTQNELLEAIWSDTYVQPEVLKGQMLDVRHVLGDDPKHPRFIATLPRRGYQFIAPVKESAGEVSLHLGKPAGNLVGRSTALRQLSEALRTVSLRQRQVTFITGEPGIGKTSLVDEFECQISPREPRFLVGRGQCVEGYGGKEAYYPVLEALAQLCRRSAGASVVEVLASQAPTWLVQFPGFVKPEQRQMLQREILGATRERMLREICEALESITSENPVLLILEDIHWVDYATVDLLSAVARRRQPARLMLIGTYRPVDITLSDHPLKALKQDLLIHHLCQEIALQPLAESDVAEYLAAQAAGTSVPKGLSELIYRHSEGNPLFMVAALEHLEQRGLISRSSGTWNLTLPLDQIDLEVPDSLLQTIEARIDRLTSAERRVLELASPESVGRSRFAVVARAAIGDLEPGAFEDVCENLSRRHFILRLAAPEQFPDGTISSCYEFVHALYREVCYRRIAPGRRTALHQRLGEWGEKHMNLRESAAWLAGHFEQGGDWQRAIKYLHVAADRAGARFEAVQATEILEHAWKLAEKLTESERAVSETGILERVAGIYAALGDVVRASQTYATLNERAAQSGLIAVQARALVELAFIESWESSERGLELLEQAFHLVTTIDPVNQTPAYAACLFFRLWLFGWNPQYAEEYRKAIKEIRKLGSRQIVASNLLDSACIQWCSSEYRESHRSHATGEKMLLDVDTVHPSLSGIRWARWQQLHMFDLLFLGEWGEASRATNEAIAMAHRNGDYFFRARALQMGRAWLHLHACDFAGVLTICESAVPLARNPKLHAAPGTPPPFPWPFQQSLILRGSAQAALREYDRAREYLFAARDDMDRQRTASDWYWRMPLEAGLTELWLVEGNLTLARPQAERFLGITLTTAERTWQALAWETNARVALAELDAPRARDCISKALATMEGFELPLASWRVHATAFDFYLHAGERDSAEGHRELSRATILQLANSLGSEEPLRRTFLSAPIILKILDQSEAPSIDAKEA
jgi:DNA-binding winged helix-turn-helix (wHTH) protein